MDDKVINAINKHLPSNTDDWEMLGFVNREGNVYPFGSDSKIIGRIFEIVVKDSLEKAAEELGYTLKESTSQTVYPDFYFELEDDKKIAIDVKTTYLKKVGAKFGFTGGSFTSYMREGNETKNIVGHADDYLGHYILGVVYSRQETEGTNPVSFDNRGAIVPSYSNIQTFIQEKYKVCGENKGSGNTDNIGTIKSSNITDFINGNGPFNYLGEEIFEDYWSHYPKYTDSKETKDSLYTSLPLYFNYIEKTDKKQAENLRNKYNEYLEERKK